MATRTCRTFTIAINIESIMVPGVFASNSALAQVMREING